MSLWRFSVVSLRSYPSEVPTFSRFIARFRRSDRLFTPGQPHSGGSVSLVSGHSIRSLPLFRFRPVNKMRVFASLSASAKEFLFHRPGTVLFGRSCFFLPDPPRASSFSLSCYSHSIKMRVFSFYVLFAERKAFRRFDVCSSNARIFRAAACLFAETPFLRHLGAVSRERSRPPVSLLSSGFSCLQTCHAVFYGVFLSPRCSYCRVSRICRRLPHRLQTLSLLPCVPLAYTPVTVPFFLPTPSRSRFCLFLAFLLVSFCIFLRIIAPSAVFLLDFRLRLSSFFLGFCLSPCVRACPPDFRYASWFCFGSRGREVIKQVKKEKARRRLDRRKK